MTGKPVLDTIRSILKFKDNTTIAEIASISELKRRHVLDVINANDEFVTRERRSGRITKVDCHTPLRNQLWESGKFYRQDTYGIWSTEGHCLKFAENDHLKDELEQKVWMGTLGDNTSTYVVKDTPENIARLEAEGLRPWSEVVLDDRLWTEGP